MASTSFSTPNQLIGGRKFCAPNSPDHRALRHQLRFSASYTTAGRTTLQNSRQTAASLYEVLGVQTGATCQEIKSAYRRLARVLHPDVASNGREEDDDDDTSAADKFIRVHEAYATLSDPEKRMVYDSSLFRQRRMTAGPSCSGYSEVIARRRQTWETDQCW